MKPALVHRKEEIAVRPLTPSTFMEEIHGLIEKIEKKAYELFEGRGREDGRDWEDWFKAEDQLFKMMPLEIKEEGKQLTIRAEVPGFKTEELEINLDPGLLTIKGVHKAESEKKEKRTVYSEIRKKEIFRQIALPANVIPDEAEANLKDGVLEITVPKAAETTTVEIKAA